MTTKPVRAASMAFGLPILMSGCGGAQSVLSPHGPVAQGIATLSWILFAITTLVFVVVIVSTYFAVRGSDGMRHALRGSRAVVVGGIAFPLVTLTLLLIYGVWLTQASVPPAKGTADLRIHVVGEQWWWRITYLGEDGTATATANEIHIPTNRVIEFSLTSADVIHSFWVPRLGGKVDALPGHVTRLALVADAPGVYHGLCSEFCGTAHREMQMTVHAHASAAAFDSAIAALPPPASADAFPRGSRR
jgi:cytochrome c oxidase subunit 2